MADLIGQRLGQYEIVALLGKGGMATVYRARQLNIERDVAIKVIRSDLVENPDFIRRFKREAETLASLNHRHILKLFDYGQQGDMAYLVMELLTGGSLADLIAQGKVAPQVASRLLDQIASALDYAHRRGLIHRDLKPHNVLLDEESNAVLTDFGIVKLLRDATALTQSGSAIGTPAYMAPEQWRGQAVDARTDIYSLGIILYEMLAGRLPFVADTPFTMMHLHVNEPPPPLRSLNPYLPSGVEPVIAKALAKDPDQRYESASALAQAFKAALTSPAQPQRTLSEQPEPSAAPTMVESQPTRRNRRALPLIGALPAALLIIGGAVAILSRGPGVTPTAMPGAASSQAVGAILTAMPSPTITTATNVPPTLTPATTVSSATPMPTSSPTTDPATWIAATRAARLTSTAVAVTIAAGVAMTDTAEAAMVMASFTRTPTPTSTFTPTPTLTPTATATATPTRTLTPIGTATPFGGGTGKIAFGSFRDGKNGIYVMDADGRNQHNLMYSGYDIDPAWSPDGSRIAFVSARDGNAEIYVMDANGTNQRRLTNDKAEDNNPAWSPDGSRIAFVSQRDGNAEIYVMDADGTNQRNLTNAKGDDSRPAWSPDGSRIAFATDREKVLDIYVMDADGKNPHNLTNSPGEDWDPTWSPDGSKIAFIANRDGNAEVYVMDANGTNQRNLTHTPSDEFLPAWSPDGTKIAFTATRDGNQEIYVMDADGQNPRNLTRHSANDARPVWQPIATTSAAALVATPTSPFTPTPTPTPTATGIPTTAILYQTDFEDGRATGWISEGGVWQVITEANGNRAYRGSGGSDGGFTHIGLSSWKDYAVEFRFKRVKNSHLEITFRTQDIGMQNFYALANFEPDVVSLERKQAGNWSDLAQQAFSANDWNTVHIEVKGDLIRASINGRSLPDAHDSTFASGYLGLYVGQDSVMLFDDIRVWSL